MIIQKWFVILCVLGLSIFTQGNAFNTCSLEKLQNTTQPATYTDCTVDNPDPGTCCYMKVSVMDDTTNTVSNSSFCAFIPGSYVSDESIQSLKKDLSLPVEINCNSTFLSISFLIFIILSSLI